MPALADQHDVIAANERLTTDLATALKERDELKTKLSTAESRLAEAQTKLEGADEAVAGAVAERDAALKERDDLKAKLDATTKERDDLAAKDSDINRRVAAEVAKHGIRAQALKVSDSTPTKAAAKTATERVLEAKGVQTLEELAAKPAK